ncbi:unnamed protein product [Dracunculus medinensis]|uniref:SnoaL-like domain-containing protein n=1 Tax=Dracunculus medinensis TaxID=318479 RepID=A0A158Q3R0_DRAME|nr:unnamed protein product [Dracunculus medinensis]
MVDSGKQLLDSLARIQTIVEHSHHSIQEQSKQLADCLLTNNVDEILSFYDEDIEFFESGTPICRGLDALRMYYSTMRKIGLRVISRKVTELHTLSPFIVIERGEFCLQRSKNVVVCGRSAISHKRVHSSMSDLRPVKWFWPQEEPTTLDVYQNKTYARQFRQAVSLSDL